MSLGVIVTLCQFFLYIKKLHYNYLYILFVCVSDLCPLSNSLSVYCCILFETEESVAFLLLFYFSIDLRMAEIDQNTCERMKFRIRILLHNK